ncbi:hypothetical protein TWF730_007910 [Orbilia blumenaviensis]|uniref:Cytochrome P450 n=1 Tax=Orbilia blumenaviensis TaxID=1796055 RepID=A0AAV9V9R3_9PEZI
MVSAVTVFFLSLPVYYIASTAVGLWRNIRTAKRSGLPYRVIPVYAFNPIWLLTGRKLGTWFVTAYPNLWISKYLLLMVPEWSWRYGFEPFAEYGDVFMTVSPVNCHIYIADREVISQITTRRDDFPKPAWMYRTVNMFGRNVVTTEGPEWKFHRKVTSPSFGEKNNALVFGETIRQGKMMLKKWAGEDARGGITIKDVLEDTMRLSLHVISGAGFGVSLQWPGTTQDGDMIRPLSNDSTHQHTLSFKDALAGLLHNLLIVLVFPKWFLANAPFKWARKAAEASLEYQTYMNELFIEKRKEAIAGEKADGMDIMGALVKNSYGPETRLGEKMKQTTINGDVERLALTDSEILGNAFVFLLAGHETSAGSLHYVLILLALHPDSQRRMQKDIDRIFGDRPVDEWDYSKDITAMQTSMLGAVMQEELRVVPPVINIPKQVTDDRDQIVMYQGKQTVWPKGAVISLSALALQRNPKYWPSTGPSKVTGEDNDLADFVPERWFLKNNVNDMEQEDVAEDIGAAGKGTGRLFHPLKGSYIPFSDGPRSCLGKRFAQVEIMILLAMIFKTYSVELAVDEVADDEAIEKMNERDRIALYEQQRTTARSTMKNCSEIGITIRIKNGYVPIRIVPRGQERFIHLFEH